MMGCIFLALCYIDWPCGRRLGIYFEFLCLLFFTYSAIIETMYGFCPVEDSSPNFFGAAGVTNLVSGVHVTFECDFFFFNNCSLLPRLVI